MSAKPKGGRSNGLRSATNGTPPQNDVLLGYLSQNDVTQSFHHSFIELLGYDLSGPKRLNTYANVRSSALVLPESRNKLCQQVLDDPRIQWLFMVDSDMGFRPDTLERLLLAADPVTRPVVGGLCFAMRESMPDGVGGMHTFPSPTILMWVEHEDGVGRFTGQDHYPVNAMIQVGATGAACLLIHRSVIERIGEDWFTRTPVVNGEMQGEDVSFCWRLMQLGIPLWVHTGIRTTHFKHLWLAEYDFWNSRVAPPAEERVDVIVPALHRPQNVARLMRSLRASTGLATAWWVCEADDDLQMQAVEAEGGRVLTHPEAHTFAQKCNLGYRLTGAQDDPAPWLLLVGDDVRFRPGWLDQAQDVAQRYSADVVGTNDLLTPRVIQGEHATHPMVRRSYVDREGASWDGPGVVCHEGYHHWYVDDEIVMAARLRNTFQPALGSHVEHVHPLNDRAPMDDVYRLGELHKDDDAALYHERLGAALRTSDLSRAVRRPELAVV